MRVNLSIFIVTISLLWSSLSLLHHFHFSRQQEVNVAGPVIQKAIVSDDDLIWKKASTHALPGFTVLSFRKSPVRALETKTTSFFTQIAVRYYLLFRVLRH